MDYKMIGVIVILVLLLILCGIIYAAYIKIRDKIRSVSQMAFGTNDMLEGMKKMQIDQETTPKSIAGTTSIYLPMIMKDFPEFHYEEMRGRAENVLRSYLRGVNEENPKALRDGTEALKDQLRLHIDELKNNDRHESFTDITLHKTEIFRYTKQKGRVSVLFQTSVGYKHSVTHNNKVIQGSPDKLEQTRYNIEAVYVQDMAYVENVNDKGIGLVCPHCGGPIEKLGQKVCPYCGCGVIELNIRTWGFSKITKL